MFSSVVFSYSRGRYNFNDDRVCSELFRRQRPGSDARDCGGHPQRAGRAAAGLGVRRRSSPQRGDVRRSGGGRGGGRRARSGEGRRADRFEPPSGPASARGRRGRDSVCASGRIGDQRCRGGGASRGRGDLEPLRRPGLFLRSGRAIAATAAARKSSAAGLRRIAAGCRDYFRASRRRRGDVRSARISDRL